jgi:hypothetical protein
VGHFVAFRLGIGAGYAALDTATDARFIESVRTYIAENIDNIALLKTAFDFSQLSYAVYLTPRNFKVPVAVQDSEYRGRILTFLGRFPEVGAVITAT